MENVLDYVRKERRRKQIKREIEENEKRIRDNRKKIELLSNLLEYLKPSMTVSEIEEIIENMRYDYEDRIDDFIIKNAELGKERREVSKLLKTMKKTFERD